MIRYFRILNRIITDRRSILQTVFHLLLMAVISFAISFVTIAPLVRYYHEVAFNTYSDYDVKMKYTDEDITSTVNGCEYIDSIVFNPMYNVIKTDNKVFRIHYSQHIDGEVNFIGEKLYMQKYSAVTDNKAYINNYLSKQLKLKAGDKFTYETTIGNETYSKEYTIAAVLEDPILESINSSEYFLLIQDMDMYEKVTQVSNYTTAFIKYTDKTDTQKLKARIKNGEFSTVYFESREVDLLIKEDEPVYNLPNLIFSSLAGTFALCLIFSHEKKKQYELNKKSIDTLYSMGARKLWLGLYMGISSFLEQLVVTIGIMFLIHKLFWQGGDLGYLSVNLVMVVLPYYIVAITIAAVYSAVSVTNGLRRI